MDKATISRRGDRHLTPASKPQTRRLAVFAKAPVEGACKTRLLPALGAAGAAIVQRRLIDRTLATAVASGALVELWAASTSPHAFFWRCRWCYPVALKHQCRGDLGQRMANALARMLHTSRSAVIVGSDCPVLTADLVKSAFAALETGANVVAAPAEDGGYGLIGLRRPCPALFRGIAWGTHRVMAQTRRRAQRLNLHLVELATVWDVDRPDEWRRARRLGWL